jgi:hypothetical protein
MSGDLLTVSTLDFVNKKSKYAVGISFQKNKMMYIARLNN